VAEIAESLRGIVAGGRVNVGKNERWRSWGRGGGAWAARCWG
jgi:hypothetical protein